MIPVPELTEQNCPGHRRCVLAGEICVTAFSRSLQQRGTLNKMVEKRYRHGKNAVSSNLPSPISIRLYGTDGNVMLVDV